MSRRDFLKFGSFLSTVFIFQLHPLIKKVNSHMEVETQGVIYRGTHDGHIMVSHDIGMTWEYHIKMGAEYSIQELFLDQSNQVRAQIGFAGHNFDLILSRNGSLWQTAQ